MRAWLRSPLAVLFVLLAIVTMAAACGSSTVGSSFDGGGLSDGGLFDGTAFADSGTSDAPFFQQSEGGNTNDAAAGFDVEPSGLQTLAVTLGQTIPTTTFQATLNGEPVSVAWAVDRGNAATVTTGTSPNGVVTPSGSAGGLVTVTAGYNGRTVSRQVLIEIIATQNGPTAGESSQVVAADAGAAALTAGGGIGGVGGEGLGPAVTDSGTLAALGNPQSTASAAQLSFLYPYDATVWPRGVLAPLIQWTSSLGSADAIQIKLASTSGSFSYTGTFGAPAILAQTGGSYVRAPIPQDVWTIATNTAGGTVPTGDGGTQLDQLVLTLTVAKGGQAYGPISETWTIAPGLLDGIIYYQSYGTHLATNYDSPGAIKGGTTVPFGGAVLSIHVGDTGPALAAGSSATNSVGCRVCHSVAAGGSALTAVHGDNESLSSTYELSATAPATEVVMGELASFPGITRDGTMALTQYASLLSLPNAAGTIPITGLTAGSNIGTPAFSPDGTLVAFNPWSPSAPFTVPGGMNYLADDQLWVMGFSASSSADGGAVSATFSSPTLVVDDSQVSGGIYPGWAEFLPDGKSLVFQQQSNFGLDGAESQFATRKGALAQIAWTSASDASHVTVLNQLNGVGYLPKLAAAGTLSCSADGSQVGAGASPSITDPDLDHSNDVNHNYEPTVNPVPAGGYVWVVFTSRRMYGSVANIPPYCSDPRGVDLFANVTTKKLWVAAIDLNAPPGTDASHPAFYLPGQELLAGNARGFWVLDPCHGDGESCSTGDQCCDGYCEPGTDGGALVCGNAPPNATCSTQGNKCAQSGDCCNNLSCVGGYCVESAPPQ